VAHPASWVAEEVVVDLQTSLAAEVVAVLQTSLAVEVAVVLRSTSLAVEVVVVLQPTSWVAEEAESLDVINSCFKILTCSIVRI
jgi:hypothetical protein